MRPQMTPSSSKALEDRRFRWVNSFGRLRPGDSAQQAKAGLQPRFHQMLEWEVQQKESAKTAPLPKQKFLKRWVDVLPAA